MSEARTLGAQQGQFPHAKRSWHEAWIALRNKTLASPRFQKWAARFPPTRPTARRKARGLFDLVAGFVYSQTLTACVRLNVFEILAAGPLSMPALALRLGLTERAAETLIKAAASLELTQRLSDGRYALGPLGAAFRGNPSLARMIEHHAMLYADLADPVALLRGERRETRLNAFWAYAGSDSPAGESLERVQAYSALMTESSALIGDLVLDAYPLDDHRLLLDVGGGQGAFLATAGTRYPGLSLMLFDLPAVVRGASATFQAAGVAGRAVTVEGDFLRGPLPRGADVISLVRVLHDHDDAPAMELLRKIREALPKGGKLLIAEPVSGTPGAEPMGDAYFGFYLAAMGSGRPRRVGEICDLLMEAGFRNVEAPPVANALLVTVLVASA